MSGNNDFINKLSTIEIIKMSNKYVKQKVFNEVTYLYLFIGDSKS